MENNFKVSDFDSVRLKLASPEDIINWSSGEITKPETINYRTQRYEMDGLFCEKIFGPSKDWECYCGKYKRIRYKGIVCDKCGVEVIKSSVRRERMGHIALATPVSHIWFLRNVPSKIGLALDVPLGEIERVIYFSAYIVTDVDEDARKRVAKQLSSEYKAKQKELEDEGASAKAMEELKETFATAKEELKSLRKFMTLSEVKYFSLSQQFAQVFSAGIGAEVVRELLIDLDVNAEIERLQNILDGTEKGTGDRKKMLKRLKFLQGTVKAGVALEWMLPTAIPVIPPDLRPMVALDGGRFATSDLNDLYRRIINRNNRLKKLQSLHAPEVITRNEKRMMQEAVDALFDNSARRGQASVAASTGQRRALRSLADSLKGKQGRFRQNLLGKRVDYSGRSVIVVGPNLQLHQVGIPKKMGLELFKPFIINKLIDREFAHNVRTAGRMVDNEMEEAYAILEEIIADHYVLLNRAPTLHRLSIQAFQPVLIEGKAIRLHPMVCAAFNADFDGDQMAVHVPLTDQARWESENLMLSRKNLLKPASGDPIISPSLDMVLGMYYLTHMKDGMKGEGRAFADMDEVIFAYENEQIAINAKIKLNWNGEMIETSAGRVLMNDILPKEMLFVNEEMTKKELRELVAKCLAELGPDVTADFVDRIKDLGFAGVSKSGISWGMADLHVPEEKSQILKEAEEKVNNISEQYNMGLLTNAERKNRSIEVWNEAKNEITNIVRESIDKEGPVYSMVYSKARGSESVVVQMMGMKGLMAGATGETIELPVRSSYKEGLDVLEYFISTHGARKGMADTALRTATAGYLTRRLVDVSQDVIVRESDCGTKNDAIVYRSDAEGVGQTLADHVAGRTLAQTVKDKEGNVVCRKGTLVSNAQAADIDASGVDEVHIYSVVTCQTRRGVCQKCYGLDLGRNIPVQLGSTVGIVAAQAIGEPGTQLTMRTFHIGGVAGTDITQGLPRVEEIFEARPPKGEAGIAEVAGKVINIESAEGAKTTSITIESNEGKKSVKTYHVPANSTLRVEVGDLVPKGAQLNDGHIDLKKLYATMGREALHRYVVREVQDVYSSQGEMINDKHVEVIVKQMLSRMTVVEPGDTTLLPGDIVERDEFLDANEEVKRTGGQQATGEPMLLGITKVSLTTESFLSAASFQETARVLINAAVTGKQDRLQGLKENVIIGRLIPAGTGFRGNGAVSPIPEQEQQEPQEGDIPAVEGSEE